MTAPGSARPDPVAPSTADRDLLAPLSGYPFERILAEERALLRELRDGSGPQRGRAEPPQDPDEFLGLAFSGGGIRSATFNLGVLQALSELRLLREFDYLSTVSGGGYIGSWLSAWIQPQSALRPNPTAQLCITPYGHARWRQSGCWSRPAPI